MARGLDPTVPGGLDRPWGYADLTKSETTLRLGWSTPWWNGWNMPRIVEKCWKMVENSLHWSDIRWWFWWCWWTRPVILKKQGGPENPKARRRTARLFLKMLWCGQLCSGRNRCKIFTETSCALMVSWATIHHSMLCQLRLHSSSRYCC